MEIRVLVSGKVQGVFFRYNVKKIADQKEIHGYAKNLADGKVEIIGQGEEKILLEFLEAVRNMPSKAEISHIDYTMQSEKRKWKDFQTL